MDKEQGNEFYECASAIQGIGEEFLVAEERKSSVCELDEQ